MVFRHGIKAFLLVVLIASPFPIARAQAAGNGAADAGPKVRLTILYDNTTQDKRIREDWGLAVLVDIYGKRLLFDAGGKSDILLHNMRELGVDPRSVEQITISHEHPDHVNGLRGFLPLANRLPVYVPASFSYQTKSGIASRARVMEVNGTVQLLPGVWLIDVPVPPAIAQTMMVTTEQVLVVSIDEGLLVLAGCSHPTSDGIVKHVSKVLNRPVRLLVGGLHINNGKEAYRITQELKRLGVKEIMPLHCSGKEAVTAIRTAYGKQCLIGGAGRILEVPLFSMTELTPRGRKVAQQPYGPDALFITFDR